jgi:membrane protein DedA with SNARE-associated domain
MGIGRFVLLTLLGSIPWNFGLAYAGYKLGENYHLIEQTFGWLTFPIAIAVIVLLIVAYLLGRRWLDREAASEPGSAA